MRDIKDDKLRLGKGATFFVKSQLKRLRQEDETWEADLHTPHECMTWIEENAPRITRITPMGKYPVVPSHPCDPCDPCDPWLYFLQSVSQA